MKKIKIMQNLLCSGISFGSYESTPEILERREIAYKY